MCCALFGGIMVPSITVICSPLTLKTRPIPFQPSTDPSCMPEPSPSSPLLPPPPSPLRKPRKPHVPIKPDHQLPPAREDQPLLPPLRKSAPSLSSRQLSCASSGPAKLPLTPQHPQVPASPPPRTHAYRTATADIESSPSPLGRPFHNATRPHGFSVSTAVGQWLLPLSLLLCGCSVNADLDGDGYLPPADCQPLNRFIFPGAEEYPYNGQDENCDGSDSIDLDHDGIDAIQANGIDCDDTDPSVYPGAPEICDDKANDCSHFIDDAHHDGHKAQSCLTDDLWGDCNDSDSTIHPHAVEVPYDGIDQDCWEGDMVDVDWDGAASILAGGDDCEDEDAATGPDTERYVSAGYFINSDELTPQLQWLPAFCLERTEVTVDAYKHCEAQLVCEPPQGTLEDAALDAWYRDISNTHRPVIGVTAAQAYQYCQFVGKVLPTPSEWLKAGRGGLCLSPTHKTGRTPPVRTDEGCPGQKPNPAPERLYPWGNAQPDCSTANFSPDGGSPCVQNQTSPPQLLDAEALQTGASPYDILQLSGNAAEWVQVVTPPFSVSIFAIKGGSYADPAPLLQLDSASYGRAHDWFTTVGFRCSRPIPIELQTDAILPPVARSQHGADAGSFLRRYLPAW